MLGAAPMRRALRGIIPIMIVAGALAASPAIAAPSLVAGPIAPTPYSTPASGIFQCINLYAPVHNEPGGLATGNCRPGNSLWRTSYSDIVTNGSPQGYFFGGYINGNYDGCGWVYIDNLIYSTGYTATGCNPASQAVGSFTSSVNCTGGCTDATKKLNPTACPAYANYRPWSTANHPVDPMPWSPVPANATLSDGVTPRLGWRYITKYASTDGTGQWVMVRDYQKTYGNGNWYFVPRSCMGL
jgi:hypothetical protein